MQRVLNTQDIRAAVSRAEDLNVLRMHYCYQIGSTFVGLSLMEDTIIEAMWMCNSVKVSKLLGSDTPKWKRALDKRATLQSSTLGTLIAVLAKHSILPDDLYYLRWVKRKRDFFVHRFFHDGGWPGDLGSNDLAYQCRKLLYLEIIFGRAGRQVWKIFGRAKLLEVRDLGESGTLIFNRDFLGTGDEI